MVADKICFLAVIKLISAIRVIRGKKIRVIKLNFLQNSFFPIYK